MSITQKNNNKIIYIIRIYNQINQIKLGKQLFFRTYTFLILNEYSYHFFKFI